ncbi:SAM-dependent methyltransferase [Thalassotalea mangrovi]|uniref:SAM-dependent methyltransferase n=1 Tax=Thalassotalea mangrovi TaxID=2572245 RepID=UPI001B8031D9|nr:cyclopropane-fatty-acyl-phospholipid synthase family protein [Thalassotalea mangrovi]
MEQIAAIQNPEQLSFFQRRCRQLVHAVLGKINTGHLELIEGATTFRFGSPDSDIKAQIIVHDVSVYTSFVKGGSIGAAEAYIDKRWTCDDLTALIRIFARAQNVTDAMESKMAWFAKVKNALFHRRNRNTVSGSKRNILAHYDLGNELYTRFLDPSMMYSAAIYPHENATLAEAQQHKLARICDQLELNENDHVLEIGTGWGGLAIFAAQHYGCRVTTTTISDEQYKYAQQRVTQLGLDDRITLLKKDYRELDGEYDKLVSVEMIEAVGHEYFESFFKQCNARLKTGGKMLIQAITIADQRFESYKNNVDFIQRYIFPGGCLPSINIMSEQIARNTHMVIESISDIGLDYAKTLAHWRDAFFKSWPELSQLGYDETFKRLWTYYLCYCEGAFLERSTSTVHLLARK